MATRILTSVLVELCPGYAHEVFLGMNGGPCFVLVGRRVVADGHARCPRFSIVNRFLANDTVKPGVIALALPAGVGQMKIEQASLRIRNYGGVAVDAPGRGKFCFAPRKPPIDGTYYPIQNNSRDDIFWVLFVDRNGRLNRRVAPVISLLR